MDDWLAIPENRKTLPTGRLCVIMALTVLLLVVADLRRNGPAPVARAEADLR